MTFLNKKRIFISEYTKRIGESKMTPEDAYRQVEVVGKQLREFIESNIDSWEKNETPSDIIKKQISSFKSNRCEAYRNEIRSKYSKDLQ